MNEVWLLTVLELRSAYGINQFRHTRDPKAKSRYRLLLGAWALVIAIVLGYVGGLVYGLCLLGLGEIAPMYLVTIASLVIFVFGIFKAGAVIFGRSGYDTLASLPVKPGSIAAGRFFAMYLQDLALTVLIFLPGMGVYALLQKPGLGFYPVCVVTAVFVPAIPLVVSTLISTAITALASRSKRKSLVQTALMLVFVLTMLLGSLALSSSAESITAEMLANLASTLADRLGGVYPPASWAGKAMGQSDLTALALYALVSLALTGLTLWLVARNFSAIMEKLGSFSSRQNYRLGSLDSRSLQKALFLREAKRYFSSSIYVTNTIIGPIMGCILAGVLCFAGVERIQSAIPLDIRPLLPFALGGVFTMMTTTACAISMEGKEFWLAKSLPIPTKALLDSKILLNLSLILPCYLVSEVLMIFALRPGLLQLVWLVVIPAAIIIFAVVFGITINRKLPSFDWEKEEQPVKQGASSAIGGFAGLLLSLVLMGLTVIVPASLQNLVNAGAVLGLGCLTWALYQKNNRTDLARL